MSEIWMDVDAALSEVPVNVMPLIDDTDFKTREESVVFNQAGMDLQWNFVTTAGAFTQTVVVPTSAGVHDWTSQNNGMYTLEIPASAGTINNDTEGFGWFTGFATGILPWRGPVIGFRDAALNNALIDEANDLATSTAQDTAQTDLDTIAGADGALIDSTEITDLVDDIWDEVLTGATHNVNNSSGKRLRAVSGAIVNEGTAQSGGNNTIQLASGAITTNNLFKRMRVVITGGTGAGQENIITSTVASTDTATVAITWLVNPDATSEYLIEPGQAHATVRNGGYDGGVFFSTLDGVAGTEPGVSGTSTNPSDVEADTYTIAANEKISDIIVRPGSTFTLPSDSTNKSFEGRNYSVLLDGQEISGMRVDRATVTGIGLDTADDPPAFTLCGLGAVTLPPSNGNVVGFFGTFTMGSAGSFTYGESQVFGDQIITFDYGASLNASFLNLARWQSGSILIKNMGQGTGSYVLRVSGEGEVTLDPTCVGGTVILEGAITFTNDGSGMTIIDENNYNETQSSLLIQAETDQLATDIAGLNDFDAATEQVDIGSLNGDTVSLLNFVDSALTITRGTATGTPTTTTMPASALPSRDDDNYKGLIIKWLTGALAGQGTAISAYDDATRTLTFTATTQAASAGDKFVIL